MLSGILSSSTLPFPPVTTVSICIELVDGGVGVVHRGRKRPKHLLSSFEIYSRMCSPAFFPVPTLPFPLVTTVSICIHVQ